MSASPRHLCSSGQSQAGPLSNAEQVFGDLESRVAEETGRNLFLSPLPLPVPSPMCPLPSLTGSFPLPPRGAPTCWPLSRAAGHLQSAAVHPHVCRVWDTVARCGQGRAQSPAKQAKGLCVSRAPTPPCLPCAVAPCQGGQARCSPDPRPTRRPARSQRQQRGPLWVTRERRTEEPGLSCPVLELPVRGGQVPSCTVAGTAAQHGAESFPVSSVLPACLTA